jgi:hypothetical protein
MNRLEERGQETVEEVKATVHSALEGFKQPQETVDGAKSVVDKVLESATGTAREAELHVWACLVPGFPLHFIRTTGLRRVPEGDEPRRLRGFFHNFL